MPIFKPFYFLLWHSCVSREFEVALDALQMDIDQLEKEKHELRRRLDASAKKSMKAEMAGLGGGFRKSFMAMVAQSGATPGESYY